MSPTRARFLVWTGVLLSGASLALLAVTVRSLLGNEDLWSRPAVAVGTLCLGLVFLLAALWGLLLIVARNNEKIFFWNLLLLFSLVLVPLLGETVFRLGIAVGLDAFRQPRLYADRFADVDYFKLSALWEPQRSVVKAPNLPVIAYDPLLGWSFPRTPDNPLGVFTELPYEFDRERQAVLFYGDSFTLHGQPVEEKIPQQLDGMLPHLNVYNYGVGGYGLDQIYLRFRESHGLFDRPIVLFGFLTTDIDRCVLDYRDAPKPHFEVTPEGLRLVPVAPENERFLEENPPRVRSYFLAALTRAARHLLAGGSSLDSDYKRQEKEALTSRLLDRVVAEANQADLDLVFVLFAPRRFDDWRRDFVLAQFRRLGAAYIDTAEILVAAETRAGRQRHLSFDETGHHSPWANRVIARAIHDYMIETGRAGEPAPPPALPVQSADR